MSEKVFAANTFVRAYVNDDEATFRSVTSPDIKITIPKQGVDISGLETVWASRTARYGPGPTNPVTLDTHSFPSENTVQAYFHAFDKISGGRVQLAEVTFTFDATGKIVQYHRDILFEKPAPPAHQELPATTGKNVLIVLSHPEKTSFSHAMAATATATLEAKGYSVVISDLYAMGFDPVNDRRNFTTVKDPTRLAQAREEGHALENDGFNSSIKAEMEKLKWCDLLIFQCPINWFGLPAMLKAWVDKVFASGFAYGGGKWYDKGNFVGKKALLCMTTGAPEFMFKPGHIQGDIREIVFPITHGMFYFCGFTPLESYFVYGPTHGDDSYRAGLLEKYTSFLQNIESAPIIQYPTLEEIDAANKK